MDDKLKPTWLMCALINEWMIYDQFFIGISNPRAARIYMKHMQKWDSERVSMIQWIFHNCPMNERGVPITKDMNTWTPHSGAEILETYYVKGKSEGL